LLGADPNLPENTLIVVADDAGAIYWSLAREDFAHGTRELLLKKLAP
jgi:hypothetical protein